MVEDSRLSAAGAMVRSSVSEDGGRGGEEEQEEESQEEGNDGPNEKSRKATREHVAAMQKESVALRAQVAAALVQQAEISSAGGGGTAPAPADPRAARRREYPVFTPSYGDDPKQQLTTAGGNKLKYGLQTMQQQQQQIKSAQLWHHEQQQRHHHHSAQLFVLDQQQQQQQQFIAQDHITPENSFRSHELPRIRSRMISPLPGPLTGLSPDGKQQHQLNLRSSSPKSAKLEKLYHCDPPVSPLSMYSGVENLQDSKRMMDNSTLGGRTRSPGISSIESGSKILRSAMVGIARDIGSRGKTIAGSTSTAALPTTSTWHNCAGGLSSVVPVAAGTASHATGSIIDPPKTPPQSMVNVAPEQAAATATPQPASSSGYFKFLVWGRKKGLLKKMGHGTVASESGSIIHSNNNNNNNHTEQDKIVNMENMTKMLELKLEESNKKRAAAVYEIRALRLAMEILDGNIKELQTQCQELQQQRFQESQMKKDLELELGKNEDLMGTESMTTTPAPSSVWTTTHAGRHSPHSRVITLKLFLTTFDNAKRSLRKLTDVICHHMWELGGSLTHVIASLSEQHKVGFKPTTQMPRCVKLLHFEAFLNQVMFESFENVNFESNGATTIFNREALQEASFQSFLHLKKQNWPDIEKALCKTQGVIVNTTFHRFFVVRMEIVISQLGKLGETNIPVSIITAFYKAVKAVWLVHHLAFAFHPAAVTIVRIAAATDFNPMYMEEVVTEVAPSSSVQLISNKQVINNSSAGTSSLVSIMVNPGFIVDKEVCKCKVLCNSKPTALT